MPKLINSNRWDIDATISNAAQATEETWIFQNQPKYSSLSRAWKEDASAVGPMIFSDSAGKVTLCKDHGNTFHILILFPRSLHMHSVTFPAESQKIITFWLRKYFCRCVWIEQWLRVLSKEQSKQYAFQSFLHQSCHCKSNQLSKDKKIWQKNCQYLSWKEHVHIVAKM